MLAYYTTLVKRSDLLSKLSEDSANISSVANDLVCKLKSFSSLASNRDVEEASLSMKEAEELSKIVSAMVEQLKNNYDGYLNSLAVVEKKAEKEVQVNQETSLLQETKQPDQTQLNSLLDAIKSLKEMKESLT